MRQELLSKINYKIDNNKFFQPILFLGNNKELLNTEVEKNIYEVLKQHKVDKNYFYKLSDLGEKLKVLELKTFMSKSNIKSSFKFQVFYIENISRATIQGQNSLLKFLEEPLSGNIIFLTSPYLSGILDTILSRVEVIDLNINSSFLKDDFFYNMIHSYMNKKDFNLLKYFFHNKDLQRDDYLKFFKTFIIYIKENGVLVELIDDISKSINLIEKNNILPKNEIDKLILKIK